MAETRAPIFAISDVVIRDSGMAPQDQAARLMGTRIEVGGWHSDAPARYGPQEAYTQAFATVCENVLVLRVCVSRLRYALCGPDLTATGV